MKHSEFEASAHMPLRSDEMFQIAADPARLDNWIPRELAPKGNQRGAAKTSAASAREIPNGMRISKQDHRLEWSTTQDGGDTWLEVRSAGGESDVIIHLSIPDGQDRQPHLQRQLEQALRRLETEANNGLTA